MKFRFHYIYFVGVADKGIDLHICWRFFWVMPYIYYVYLRVPCHLLCEELSSNGGAWDVQAWSPFLSYTMFSLNEQNSLKLNFVSRNIALVISSALCILKSIFQFLFHSQWFFFLIFETPYLLDAGI